MLTRLISFSTIVENTGNNMQTTKKEVLMASCDRCGNTWMPRVKNPVKCPKCGHRFDWEIKKPHSFLPKKENQP
jgi:predicted Zn-ribbon and HTH transcriptional regulator